MELNPAIRRLAVRLLPRCIRDLLDPVEARIRRETAAFAADVPLGAAVLDAGCGENRFKALFPGRRFVGYDQGVGDARWDYARVDVLGDLERLAVRSDAVDAAMLLVVLEHVRRPGEVLREVARVLRPGGRLLAVVPLLWEAHQEPHDYFRFTRHGIRFLLEEAGLEPQRIEPLGGFFTLAARRSVNLLAFFQRSWRWVFFVLLAPFFGLLVPLLLRALDPLDHDRAFTLGYVVHARKPA